MGQQSDTSEHEQGLSLRLGVAFSPAAPVNETNLFAGRQQQLHEISDAVNQRGMHAVLFGERGVGKTSLANVLPQFLELAGLSGLGVSRVNCDSLDTYASLWHKALRELQIATQIPMAGFGPDTRTDVSTMDGMLPENPSPEDMRYVLQRLGSRVLFVIDEFDRVQDQFVRRLMADTIKALSDHSVNATVVVVGVADTVDELLSEHQSIDRCLIQIQMPRMSLVELSDILDKGFSQVNMAINGPASEFITYLSHGLPHYTHLLGLASGRVALTDARRDIQLEDAVKSIEAAVHQAQQSIMVAYDVATASLRPESLLKQVLLACAMAPVDELGYFAAADVRDPLSRIMGRTYNTPAFARHLVQFCDSSRGAILQRTGKRYHYRYRFSNPLMQPYVLINGFHQQLITLETLGAMRGSA